MIVNQSLVGGRLLSIGVHGCIFTPPLECKLHTSNPKHPILHIPNNRMISKLTIKSDADKEWKISEIIQKIPMYDAYFAIAESICSVNPIQSDLDFRTKCPIVKEAIYKQAMYDKLIDELRKDTIMDKLQKDTIIKLQKNKIMNELRILQMPYRGKSLRQYALSDTFDFKNFIIRLLGAGALLVIHGIVHYDLHDQNIIVSKTGVPRIIDFGGSIQINDPISRLGLESNYKSMIPFFQYSVDYIALLGKKNKYDNFNIKARIKKGKYVKYLTQILGLSNNKIEEELNKLLTKNKVIFQGDLDKWFDQYWQKMDSYAIGINLLEMVETHAMAPQIRNPFENETTRIKTAITYLCTINPDERWDCVQALYYLDPTNQIITKYGGTKWLEKHGYPVKKS